MPSSSTNDAIQEAIQEKLVRERAAILARISGLERDAGNLELDTDGVPPSGYEREQAISAVLDSRLADIDNALSRLQNGTYGVCADCGAQIPPRRLEALPFATLCVQCQSVADKRPMRRVHR